jgi:2-C-methyl-D-erythritol 4-phosphate cytidylyltransferase
MTDRLWVVIPAAGVGRRMTGDVPKQYLHLVGRSVIEWSIAPFLERSDITSVVVALAANDRYFAALPIAQDARLLTTIGGAERADSVLCGLQALNANDRDWVLVHDAVRPCLHRDDLARLIAELASDEVGGLLATPLTDTLKSANSAGRVLATASREHLWRAFTPQMFRFGVLQRALSAATGKHFTDESAAIEALGLRSKLVVGRSDNIKITVAEDMLYAELILQQRMTK